MKTYRIEITLTEKGKLNLQNLPFKQGDEVEVIIMERRSSNPNSKPHSLRGTVISYEYPFEPAVPVEDWDVLR
jgi:hypothetical protein